jgi:methyl-accepting chemotaxis protein
MRTIENDSDVGNGSSNLPNLEWSGAPPVDASALRLAELARLVSENGMVLSGASEELTDLGEQMANSADHTVARATEVTQASNDLTHRIQTVASSATTMSTSISEIVVKANSAARFATAAVQVADRANSTVAKLGEISKEIAKIIKVITAVAQQTNLLALNAAIEAARAGAAGKGFAVVANEVKELARETTRATDEIGLKIERINADTLGAVQAIGEVSEIINQINGLQSSIAAAVEEQLVTTGSISKHASCGAEEAHAIASGLKQMTVAAQTTSQAARESQNAANAVAGMSNELINLAKRSAAS